MALTFYSHIDTDEVARQLSNDAKGTLETLGAMAEIFEDEDGAEDFAAEMVRTHAGLRTHRAVLPFLRILTEHLEKAEADQVASP